VKVIRENRIRKLLESYGVAALLVLVALRQIALSQTRGLSPWKGGGFGMFSSLDRAETRLLRCDLVTGSSRTPVALSRSERMSRLASKARSEPTRPRLEALAAEIERELSAQGAGGARPGVHIEVRRLRYRSRDHRLLAELLADVDRPPH
jgi:hypothetical protein